MQHQSRRTWLAAALAVAASALFPGAAQALNYQHYPIGERAAGMGGAYIALSADASGCYYNPGGLAFATANSFSLTGTVYGFSRARLSNAVSMGNAGGDLSVDTFYAIPSLFGTVYRFGALRFDDQGPKDNVLGFSIVSPDYFNFRNETEYENGRQTFNSRFFNQTYWFGPSYARRLSQNFGLGATVYGLFNQEEFHSTFSGTFNERDFSIVEDKLDLLSNYDSDRKWLAVLAQVGASFAWRDFHAGLVLRSPTLQAWGSGVEDQQTIVGYQSEHQLENNHVKFTPKRQDPFMAGLGVAMERRLLYAVAADLTYHGAVSYRDADKQEVADDEELAAVVNGAVGAEYVIRERVPLQAGFYTNFSPYEDTKVDAYGVTASAGLYHKQTTFNLGLNYAWGAGGGSVTRLVERKGELVPRTAKADASITTVNVMLSTSYRFGGN